MDKLVLFAWGIISGIIPCILWGSIGGDDAFKAGSPRFTFMLNMIHHWQLGLLLMFFATYFGNPLVLGWGVGTAIDDLLFHSFEGYFSRE